MLLRNLWLHRKGNLNNGFDENENFLRRINDRNRDLFGFVSLNLRIFT